MSNNNSNEGDIAKFGAFVAVFLIIFILGVHHLYMIPNGLA